MREYIAKVKQGFRDQHHFIPTAGTNAEPVFEHIPDGEYPMLIDGKIDYVRIENARIHCQNFLHNQQPDPLAAVPIKGYKQEAEELLQWKIQATELLSHLDLQTIADIFGIGMGERISTQVIPRIRALIQENDDLRNHTGYLVGWAPKIKRGEWIYIRGVFEDCRIDTCAFPQLRASRKEWFDLIHDKTYTLSEHFTTRNLTKADITVVHVYYKQKDYSH